MRQEAFERSRVERWARFEAMLEALERRQPGGADFPPLYRLVCQDLALARDRGFGAGLVARLNALTLRGHQHLYGARAGRANPVAFLARGFPAALRREARLFWIMTFLFYGATLLLFALDLRDPSLIYSVLGPEQVANFEEMYDPDAAHYGTPRDTVGDLGAFAFYVSNNVGIALRTFAWGLFAGVGSLFLILVNGVMFGVVAAHITLEGHAEPFFSFVIGHGAFELTAIVISGVAGMKLGWSLLAPGRSSRGMALRRAAAETVPLLYGFVAMLLVAAVLEAFWSSSRLVPPAVKLGVGVLLWATVAAWLGFGGRSRAD